MGQLVAMPTEFSISSSKVRKNRKSSKHSDSRSDSRNDHNHNHSRSNNRDLNRNRRTVVSTDPTQFRPIFDLISELSHNREAYQGSEAFTLCFVPSYLRTCLERVRARVGQVATSKPGLSVTVAACIDYGTSAIHGQDDVARLIDIKNELDLMDGVKADYLDQVVGWIRGFNMAVPNANGAHSVKRMNIFLNEYLKMRLFDMASDLGMSASNLSTIATMYAIADQPGILPEHSELLHAGVYSFIRQVKLRTSMAKALTDWLQGKV